MSSAHIITSRLALSPLQESDSEFIRELVNTKGWIKFIGERNVGTPERAKIYVQELMYNPAIRYFTVRLLDSHMPLGIITVIKRSYLPHHDLGFAFLPQHAGKGYAFEAAQAVLDQHLSQSGSPTMLATTMSGNTASIQLLQKLGFGFEKQIKVENETLLLFSYKPR